MPTLPSQPALELECPACAGPLAPSEAGLACRDCGQRWPVHDGVPHLGQGEAGPADLPLGQLRELVALAASAGWQVALHDRLRLLDDALYRRAVDEYRAQWRCLVPRDRRARVLDLRCAWGPITISLAEDFGQVVAADPQPELARFTALRARQSGAHNVHALSFDPARRLPFKNGYFDVVIVHELLEWTEAGAFLAEVARVTAPGGSLFVCAGNRLNLAAALQSLPRLSAPAENGRPAAGGRRPRPLTLVGYHRALAAAGYHGHAAYALLPSVAEPFFMVPLSTSLALKYQLNSLFNDASLEQALRQRHLLAPYQLARLIWRAVSWLPVESLAQYFLPAYAVLARKSAPAA